MSYWLHLQQLVMVAASSASYYLQLEQPGVADATAS